MSQEKLFAELATDLYQYAMYKLGNKENAEDVVSETFVRLLQQPEQKKISKPWAIGILRNVIMEKYREIAKSGFDLDETLLPGKTQYEAQALDEELLKLLTAELNNLENETREVIVLKTWEELRFEEIAEVMSLNINNVKAKYYRGIEDLKMKLNTEDKDKKARSVALPVILLGIAQLAKAQTFTPSAEFLSALWQQTGSGLGSLIINSNNMTSTVKDLLARKLVWAAMTTSVVVVAATAIVGIQLSKSRSVATPGETKTATETAPTQTDTGNTANKSTSEEPEHIYYTVSSNTGVVGRYYVDFEGNLLGSTDMVTVKSLGNSSYVFSRDDQGVYLHEENSDVDKLLFKHSGEYLLDFAMHQDGTLYVLETSPNDSRYKLIRIQREKQEVMFEWYMSSGGVGGGDLPRRSFSLNISPDGKYIVANSLGLFSQSIENASGPAGDNNYNDYLVIIDHGTGGVIYKEKLLNEMVGFLDNKTILVMTGKNLSKLQKLNLETMNYSMVWDNFNGRNPEISPDKTKVASWITNARGEANLTTVSILDLTSGEIVQMSNLLLPEWVDNTSLVAITASPLDSMWVHYRDSGIATISLQNNVNPTVKEIVTGDTNWEYISYSIL